MRLQTIFGYAVMVSMLGALGACDGAGADDDGADDTVSAILDGGGNTRYRIGSVASGKALDLAGSSHENGASVQQWGYWGAANQQWTLRDAGGHYAIVSAESGKCLDVVASSKDDGAKLQQWDCWNGANQLWDLRAADGGSFQIVNVGSGKCLDVPGGDKGDGLAIQQYSCWGGRNQRWTVDAADGTGGGDKAFSSLREAAESGGRLVGVALSTGHLGEGSYRDVAANEFDYVTPENELKWDATEPDRGRFTFDGGDAIVGFAEQHGMKVKGHTLVWHSQLPSWVQGLSDVNDIRRAMYDHIRAVAGRYKGRVVAWDVVNEAIDDGNGNALRDSVFHKLGDTFIDEAFRVAHEVDPDALLFYNDYGIEGLGGKSDAAYNLAKRLVQSGVPISGVGLQMHIDAEGWPSSDDIRANIQRLTDLGLKVNISEIDVNVCGVGGDRGNKLEAQKRRYHDVIRACTDNGRCQGVTLWGVTDKYSWLNSFAPCGQGQSGSPWPLAFDDDFNRKPAWQGIADALAGR